MPERRDVLLAPVELLGEGDDDAARLELAALEIRLLRREPRGLDVGPLAQRGAAVEADRLHGARRHVRDARVLLGVDLELLFEAVDLGLDGLPVGHDRRLQRVRNERPDVVVDLDLHQRIGFVNEHPLIPEEVVRLRDVHVGLVHRALVRDELLGETAAVVTRQALDPSKDDEREPGVLPDLVDESGTLDGDRAAPVLRLAARGLPPGLDDRDLRRQEGAARRPRGVSLVRRVDLLLEVGEVGLEDVPVDEPPLCHLRRRTGAAGLIVDDDLVERHVRRADGVVLDVELDIPVAVHAARAHHADLKRVPSDTRELRLEEPLEPFGPALHRPLGPVGEGGSARRLIAEERGRRLDVVPDDVLGRRVAVGLRAEPAASAHEPRVAVVEPGVLHRALVHGRLRPLERTHVVERVAPAIRALDVLAPPAGCVLDHLPSSLVSKRGTFSALKVSGSSSGSS